MFRITALLFVVLLAGCSDGVSPARSVEGTYDLVAILPNGANVSLGGTLELAGGTATMSAALLPPYETVNLTGTYSARRRSIDVIITFEPSGVEAVYGNGHIIYDYDGIEMRWLRAL